MGSRRRVRRAVRPSDPPPTGPDGDAREARCRMTLADVGRGRPLLRRHRVRAVRRRRLRRRVLGPHRRRREAGRAPARADRPLDRSGVGGEPRLADLLPRGPVDRVLRGVRVDHAHAVRPADARGVRHRAARIELRVPQGRVPHPRPAQLRRRVRAVVGARAVLHGRGRRRDRVGPGARPAVEAGDPWDSWVNPTSILGGVLAVTVCAYLSAVYLTWDAKRLHDDEMAEYFRRRAIGAGVVAGVVAFVGIFVFDSDATLPLRRPDVARAAARDPLGDLRRRIARPAGPRRRPRRPVAVGRRGRIGRHRVGRRAVAVHAADVAEGLGGRRPVGHACRWCSPCSSPPP